jgi:hypothetical protein
MAGKTVKSAAQIAQNWSAAMQAPTTAQKYAAGVNAVTQSPMAAAATPAAQQKYLASVTAAVNNGHMAAQLNATPLQTWKTNASSTASTSFAKGASKGMPKMTAAMQRMQPGYQAASDAAAAIPNDGTATSISSKVIAAINAMKTAAGKPTV